MTGDGKICLVTGVGPGTGTALVERFAAEGYRIAMLARSEHRLRALEERFAGAEAFVCDVADPDALAATHRSVCDRLGPPDIAIHNAVGGAFGDYLTVEAAVLERNFQINVMALFALARLTVPSMIARGGGVLMATGNTSAYRGKAMFAGFSPTKAAQRMLLESIARKSGPDGIHSVYVAIDAVIDVPWTRERFPDKPDDFFCKPVDIADECFRVAHQRRSTWSSDIIIRPFSEPW